MTKELQLEFLALLSERLDRGREEYGDTSFDRPIPATVREIEEELLDVAGWVFVLWVQMGKRMAAVEAAARRAEGG